MEIEDAEKYLIRWIREKPRSDYANYGYDIYISNVIRWALAQQGNRDHHTVESLIRTLSVPFYAAAWELCRRGIIRPGVRQYGQQSTEHGSGGEGYSITPFGQTWADESDKDDFVPTEPERFGKMLATFRDRYGSAFQERAQEAVRCYGAHAYIACCAMCGAAAESILIAACVESIGEAETLKIYATASGRSRLQKKLFGQSSEHIQREFNNLAVLLKYWRDEAAHGKASRLADNEAYTSLAVLLRMAQFFSDNWGEITS